MKFVMVHHSTEIGTALSPCIVNMTDAVLGDITEIENNSYTNPWSRKNFKDAIEAGYHCLILKESPDGAIMGYLVAMKGFEEVHLLNITVAPAFRKKGCALVLLEALRLWTLAEKKAYLWLEVRQSNIRAHCIYEEFGFQIVGTRRNYYPVVKGVYEDAILMSLQVC